MAKKKYEFNDFSDAASNVERKETVRNTGGSSSAKSNNNSYYGVGFENVSSPNTSNGGSYGTGYRSNVNSSAANESTRRIRRKTSSPTITGNTESAAVQIAWQKAKKGIKKSETVDTNNRLNKYDGDWNNVGEAVNSFGEWYNGLGSALQGAYDRANARTSANTWFDKETLGNYQRDDAQAMFGIRAKANQYAKYFVDNSELIDKAYGAGATNRFLDAIVSGANNADALQNKLHAEYNYYSRFNSKEDYDSYQTRQKALKELQSGYEAESELPTMQRVNDASAGKSIDFDVSNYKDVINSQGFEKYMDQARSSEILKYLPQDLYNTMTPTERGLFMYLKDTEGFGAADNFVNSYRETSEARNAEHLNREFTDYAEENPFAATVFSVGAGLASPLGTLGNAVDLVFNGEINENAWYNDSARVQSTIRNTVMQNLSEGGQFAYGVATSVADNLAQMAVGSLVGIGANLTGEALSKVTEQVTLGLMGTQVFNQTLIEGKQQGKSIAEITTDALFASGIEILTEKIGLDAIFGADVADGMIKYLLRSSGSEAAEEMLSDVLNAAYEVIGKDIIVNQGLDLNWSDSELKTTFDQYRQSGFDGGQALLATLRDFGANALADGLAGFASGIALSGTMGAVSITTRMNSVGQSMLGGDSLSQVNDGEKFDRAALAIQPYIEQARASGNGHLMQLARSLELDIQDGNLDKYSVGELVVSLQSEVQRSGAADLVDLVNEYADNKFISSDTLNEFINGEGSKARTDLFRHMTGIDLTDSSLGEHERQTQLINGVRGFIENTNTEVFDDPMLKAAGFQNTLQDARRKLFGMDFNESSLDTTGEILSSNAKAEEVSTGKNQMAETTSGTGLNIANVLSDTVTENGTTRQMSAMERIENLANQRSNLVENQINESAAMFGDAGSVAFKNNYNNSVSTDVYFDEMAYYYGAGMESENASFPDDIPVGTTGHISLEQATAAFVAGRQDAGFTKGASNGEQGRTQSVQNGEGNRLGNTGSNEEGRKSVTGKANGEQAAYQRYLDVKQNKEAKVKSIAGFGKTLIVPNSMHDADMVRVKSSLEKLGYKVSFVVTETYNGTNGLYISEGNQIYILDNNPWFTIEQAGDHESVHGIFKNNPELREVAWKYLESIMSTEQLREMTDKYAELYDGVIQQVIVDARKNNSDVETAVREYLYEEIFADAFAGMNVFGTDLFGAAEFKDNVRSFFNENDFKLADGSFNNGTIRFSKANMNTLSGIAEEYDSLLDDIEGNKEQLNDLMLRYAAKKKFKIRAYHGTARADRVGTVFRADRATSGPMAFFTDDYDIAESYSRNKADTSLAYEEEYSDYTSQFRIKGRSSDMTIKRAWASLPYMTQRQLAEKASHITLDDDGENVIYDPDNKNGIGDYQYELRNYRGNAVAALIEGWLDGGTLFGEEEKFMDVLELSGITEAFKKQFGNEPYWKNPDYREEKVYDVLLKIENPFDASDSLSEEWVRGFEDWYEKQDHRKYERKTANADMWDKNNIDAYEFARHVRSDIENNVTGAWTSIPDSVTDYLKSLGYDGIKDKGGKGGGASHTVWIPFSSEQIKSADPVTYHNGIPISLSDRFDKKNPDIRFSKSYVRKINNLDNTVAEGDFRIHPGMSDEERTFAIKDKRVVVPVYSGQSESFVERGIVGKEVDVVKETLKTIREYFEIPEELLNKEMNVHVVFSNGTAKESFSKETDPVVLARLYPIIEHSVKYAIPIEIHDNRYFYDTYTAFFVEMFGGYVEDKSFVPIRYGIKVDKSGTNNFYVIIGNKKTGVVDIKSAIDSTSRPVDIGNLSQIIKDVNNKDIIKYFPDGLLTDSQISLKREGEEDTRNYTIDKDNNRYTEYLDGGRKKKPLKTRQAARDMLKRLAKSRGFETTDLYHGTGSFGFTSFAGKYIWTTTSKSVAAGYGQNYAEERELRKKYVADDGTDNTLFKNAENVLGQHIRNTTKEDIDSTIKNIKSETERVSNLVNDAWVTTVPGIDEETENALSWVLSLPGSIEENLDYMIDNSSYIEEVKSWVEHFNDSKEKVREWFSDHPEIAETDAKAIRDVVMGFDLSDYAIDVEYKLFPALNPDGYAINSDSGAWVEKGRLRDVIEERKYDGVYHLYGKLGDNPLIIDCEGGMWFNVPYEGKSTTTDSVVADAFSKGYTSVVFKNIMDIAMNNHSSNETSDVYVFNDNRTVKSADIEVLDDDGNRVPFLDRFNDKNRDLRHSKNDISGNDLRVRNAELEKNYKSLQKQLADAKAQTKLTEAPTVRYEDARSIAIDVKKAFNLSMNTDELGKKIEDLGNFMLQQSGENDSAPGEMFSYEDVKQKAIEIANDAISTTKQQKDLDALSTVKDIRNHFKNGIKVSDTIKGDIADYENFRKAHFNMFNQNGIAVDILYEELKDAYPYLFPEEIVNPTDQLYQIIDTIDALRGSYISFDKALAIEEFANTLMDQIMSDRLRMTLPTFADRKAAEMSLARERFENALDRERERRAKAIEEIKNRYNKKDAARREKELSNRLRKSIETECKNLDRLLFSPTDKKHIPEQFRTSVATVLGAINRESRFSYGDNGKLQPNRFGEPTNRTAAFRNLLTQYNEIAREGLAPVDPDLLGLMGADGTLVSQGLIQDVIDMGNTPISEMSSADLEKVRNVLMSVKSSINGYNKLFSSMRYENVKTVAEKMRVDLSNKATKREFRNSALLKGENLLTVGMLKPWEYFNALGDTGYALFKAMRKADDQRTMYLAEAKEWLEKNISNRDYRKLENEMHDVELGGQKFKLSTAQIMELYVLSRRDQGLQHIMTGGILPMETTQKGVFKTTFTDAINGITDDQLNTVFNMLTAEQIQDAQKLQEFLSTVVSGWGNDASMQVYGYKKFKEKNYWRIRSNRNELKAEVGKDFDITSMSNKGFTKAVSPNANTSVYIGSIFDSFNEHLQEMASYSAFLGTMEDVNRIRNYKWRSEDGYVTQSVAALINKVHGSKGTQYLQKLLTDISNPKRSEESYFGGMIGKWKASAVSANLRVVFQQPMSIMRAFDMINPIYLVGDAKGITAGWEKAQKYAPIAVWKDWGFFDVNTGRQIKDIMFKNTNFLDRANDFLMKPAGKADEIAWGMLWNACENETKALHKELEVGSEEFYKAVADRFEDVVDRTQVVDGILQRSDIMRSSNMLDKMATNFMGEPTSTYNMAYDAARRMLDNPSKKNIARVVRTSLVLALNSIGVAAASALMDAFRDKDKDKKNWGERWVSNFAENVVDNFNPITYIPYLKDIWSIIQGYDVTRSDMQAVTNLYKAIQQTYNAMFYGKGTNSTFNSILNLIARCADMTGVPAYTIKRDLLSFVEEGIWDLGDYYAQYTLLKVEYGLNSNNKSKFMDLLYRASQDDPELYQRIYDDMVKHQYFKTDTMDTEKVIENAMRDRRKNDEKLNSAASDKFESLTGTSVYGRASDSAREKVEQIVSDVTTNSGHAVTYNAAIADWESHGMKDTDYLLYMMALYTVDKPTESGKLGTFTNAEIEEALNMLGLSNSKKSTIWEEVLDKSEKNNPYK